MEDITKLMVEQLRDAYSAEKQGLKVAPKLVRQVTSPTLKQALQAHVEQSEAQIDRLEKALEIVGGRPGRKVCEGMRGLIEEAQSELEDHERGPLLDVVIIGAQQRMEHYEIAAYGTMVALAKAAGQQEVADLLAQTLVEEKQADEKLSEVGEGEVNPAAVQGGGEAAQDRKGAKRSSAA